jgi:HD-GYP domain-containing protein (c-di-GMP phosphodiesterase class II)
MVVPGMKLGKRIYNEEGLTLLGERVELTKQLIDRLAGHGIDFIYIDDPRTNDIEITQLLDDEVRVRAISEIKGSFRKVMGDSLKRKSPAANLMDKSFRGVLSMIVDDLSSHKDAMIMLTNISIMDDYLFQHSLNVCIYTTMLGISYGYSRDELMTIALGALLHDIGKTQIPSALLKKKEKLTDEEYELIKRHTEYGFRLLKDEPNVPLLAAHCALQHHERLDGSGYPRGLKGLDIHEYARWIGIADSYDAMTTHRVYRNAMLPHQAMEILYAGAETMYEKKKIELFRDKVAIYPVGVSVRLSTGQSGVVVRLDSKMPQRPVVRVLNDHDGVELSRPYEIDLTQQLNLIITEVNEMPAISKML